MIVGTGNVGASIAYALVNQRTSTHEIILADLNRDDALGEAMDLNDAITVAPSFLKINAANDYCAAGDCDICVITAGANQKVGETRTDLAQKNARILKEIVNQVMAAGFKGIFVIVSNPVDTLSYLAWQYSGLPAERVIGSGTILDSARLRFAIAQKIGVHPKSVHAYQVGEHGDSEFALWSAANIGGERLAELLSEPERAEIEKTAREKAYQIIAKKGATHFGIATCVVQIINCIFGDERRVLPISSYDDCAKIYNGFPAILGKNGVIRRLAPHLNEAEGVKMQQSINALRATLAIAEKNQ